MRAIHVAGVVHRDLKPSNVLVTADGPRVIDLGVASAVGTATLTGSALGTPGFLAPEQHRTSAPPSISGRLVLLFLTGDASPSEPGNCTENHEFFGVPRASSAHHWVHCALSSAGDRLWVVCGGERNGVVAQPGPVCGSATQRDLEHRQRENAGNTIRGAGDKTDDPRSPGVQGHRGLDQSPTTPGATRGGSPQPDASTLSATRAAFDCTRTHL
ncbi:protein kinase domain-containing protein [Nocardia asiatica]|uniref:protein kinase domain-containing protein n=1 Tax=Nocardia asiatica TaxID=209252 RepID=UPI003EDECFD1